MQEDLDDFPVDDTDRINTYFTVFTPSIPIPQKTVRSVNIQSSDEMSISQVTLLILEDNGNGYRFRYQTNARSPSKQEGGYIFNALLSSTVHPVKLLILANAELPVNLEIDDTEDILKQKINMSFTPEWRKKDFPMFGETFLPDGLTEQGASLTSTLVRSISRVDVINYSEDFELQSIQVYRANNKLQVIPQRMINNLVHSASVPADAIASVQTVPVIVNGSSSMSEIYLPESLLPSENKRKEATCVVIGGIYKGDKYPTYYRMDFVPDSNPQLFGQVLRNYRYVFQIQQVLGSGWQTPDDAANNDPSGLEVVVKEWNTDTIHMEFDDYHYLGVSTRNVYLEYHKEFSSIVQVDTDLDNYKVYWLTEDNEKHPEGTEMGWGDSSVSPDNLFIIHVSPNGQSIKVTTCQKNTGNESFTGSFLIEAGRMRIRIWIEQDIPRMGARHIYVFSARVDEIGGFGSYILGMNYPARDRTYEWVAKLKNPENFGPMGKVHFDGFLFGGNTTSNIPETTANLFDVLHFTYPATPNEETAEVVYNWVKSSKNRVLIFHYDNVTMNMNLKARFGLETKKVDLDRYLPVNCPTYVHPDAPDVILKGSFGEVDKHMMFRTYDTTQGMIAMEEAARHNITPILVQQDQNGNISGVVLGIDFANQIVYCGDIDLYSKHISGEHLGEVISGKDNTLSKENNAEVLMGNLFAWIAKTVLTD
ncbi:MAG: hypothetical protein LIP01_14065 [Tannerellaceae bacterium]|nr:hypothetical protein [Tannerellaceae bacterium]